MKNRYAMLAVLAAFLAGPALAQQPPSPQPGLPLLKVESMSPYPSVYVFEGSAIGGSTDVKFALGCGYAVANGQGVFDPSYVDLLLQNVQNQKSVRYQIINGKPVMVADDPQNPGRYLMQVAEPDSSIKAKSCRVDDNTGMPSDCRPVTPFLSAANSVQYANYAGTQCDVLIKKSQIDTSGYSDSKTYEFKNRQRARLAILEE